MSLKLHVFPPSPRAFKVMAVANHLGVECETCLVDMPNGAHRRPEFLTLNPNGKMPVLEDDGFVLWESNAILEYLASKKPRSGLMPVDARGRADVARWLLWDMAHWDPTCAIFIFERLVKPMFRKEAPDPAEIAKGEEMFHRFAGVLEGQLKGRRHVCGDTLTIVDFALAAPLTTQGVAQFPLSSYPEIGRWYAGMMGLPCWQQTLTKQIPAAA